MKLSSLIAGVAVIALAVPTLAQAVTFSYRTLDNPADPTFNQLLGINDSGVIVGYYGNASAGHPTIGYEIAAPYKTFSSNNLPGSIQTQATGINNAGLTTGFWSDTNLGGGDANFGFLRLPVGKAFRYIDINEPSVGGTPHITQVLGINKNDVVAGFYLDAAGVSHGFTYDVINVVYATVGSKFPAAATGINDNNVISGFYMPTSTQTVGFTRTGNGGVTTSFNVPGSTNTQLLGINNSNVAVGFYADKAGIDHGLYYTPSNGAWVVVNDPSGVMGTVVNGINNKNQLVGFYTDAAGNTHGMLVTVTP
jgi:hypothetical protein